MELIGKYVAREFAVVYGDQERRSYKGWRKAWFESSKIAVAFLICAVVAQEEDFKAYSASFFRTEKPTERINT